MKALTQESKARFFAHHMVDGNKFVLNEEAYYDESNPKESMGIGVKSIGFEFTFDWCITPNAFRYGNGVFPFKFIARSAALLTTLSQITDEDAIEVLKIFGQYNAMSWYKFITKTNSWKETFRQVYTDDPNKDGGCQGIDAITVHANFTDKGLHALQSNRDETYWKALDFLRSKGYALPYLGLSVDEMVSAGWIKLSEKGGKTDE